MYRSVDRRALLARWARYGAPDRGQATPVASLATALSATSEAGLHFRRRARRRRRGGRPDAGVAAVLAVESGRAPTTPWTLDTVNIMTPRAYVIR